MSQLQRLAPEIRRCIYEFVFGGLHVRPAPAVYVQFLDDEEYESVMLDEKQASELGPPSLFLTSKAFFQDPNLLKAFYSCATFCRGRAILWSQLKAFLDDKMADINSPVRLITAIKDMPFADGGSTFEIADLTPDFLPNLRHVHMTLFDQWEEVFCRPRHSAIREVHEYSHYDEIDCDECGPPLPASDHQGFFRVFCGDHSAPTPARFGLQTPNINFETPCFYRWPQTIDFDFHHPKNFVLTYFFNDLRFSYPNRGVAPLAKSFQCKRGRFFKERILKEQVVVHMSWKLLFGDWETLSYYDELPMEDWGSDTEADYSRVTVYLSSDDWIMRYHWKGQKYEISQEKPDHYDEQTKRFVKVFDKDNIQVLKMIHVERSE